MEKMVMERGFLVKRKKKKVVVMVGISGESGGGEEEIEVVGGGLGTPAKGPAKEKGRAVWALLLVC